MTANINFLKNTIKNLLRVIDKEYDTKITNLTKQLEDHEKKIQQLENQLNGITFNIVDGGIEVEYDDGIEEESSQ